VRGAKTVVSSPEWNRQNGIASIKGGVTRWNGFAPIAGRQHDEDQPAYLTGFRREGGEVP